MISKLRNKNLETWLKGYLQHKQRKLFDERPFKKHLLVSVCDHYEPLWGNPSHEQGKSRVDKWTQEYEEVFSTYRDADGKAPIHSFFFPGEEYHPSFLDGLNTLAAKSLGEVELHIHHDNETSEGLRSQITDYLDLFSTHGHVSKNSDGDYQYSFIHGNWALANGRKDGRWCGVDDELNVLFETGCYADFTFPSAPDECQPNVVNCHYWPMGELDKRRPYDLPQLAKVGCFYEDRLLMMTGPLELARRGKGLRIESSAIDASDPPSIERIDRWVKSNIHIKGRPEWVFVKVHTHGAPEENAKTYLGRHGQDMHHYLSTRYNDGNEWNLHYVSAREMYNIAAAAMHGESGNPNHYRNYRIPPPAILGAKSL